MSNFRLITKRSMVSGTVPPTSSLLVGELAINAADGGLYYLHTSGALSGSVQLVRAAGGGGAGSSVSASYAVTSSYATLAQNVLGSITSASYALTASYALNGGGGGSGDTFTLYDSFAIPSTTSGHDDFFTGSIIDTKWTGVNFPSSASLSASINSAYGSLSIISSGSGDVLRALLQPIPTGNFTCTVYTSPNRADFTYPYLGLLLTDGTGSGAGTQVGVGLIGDYNPAGLMNKWVHNHSNFNAYGGAQHRSATAGRDAWIRIVKSGSVYFAGWSSDGQLWDYRDITVSFTAAYVGIQIANNSGVPYIGTFKAFQVSNTPFAPVGTVRNVGGSGASSVSASYALTASYALNGGGGPSVSSSYAVTSSYATLAQNVLGSITSASYALTASYALNGGGGGPSVSSSYATTASYATLAQDVLGSITSASYALTASYALNGGGGGPSVSSSYATTASYALAGPVSTVPAVLTKISLTQDYSNTITVIASSSYAATASVAIRTTGVFSENGALSIPTTASLPIIREGTLGGRAYNIPNGVRVATTSSTSNSNQLVYALTPITSGTVGWQATGRFRSHTIIGNWVMAGLMVRSITSASVTMGRGSDSVAGFNRNTFSDDTTWTSVGGVATWHDANFWLRVMDSGSTRFWFASADGDHFQRIHSETRSTSAVITGSFVGMFVNPNYGGTAGLQGSIVALDCLSWVVEPLD